MKKTTKYLDIVTKLLTEIYKTDYSIVATIIYANADRDYETIYKVLKSFKNEIETIECKFKQEGNL